ncbi:MAG: J domain-containing protein [Myxococcota bacterium]
MQPAPSPPVARRGEEKTDPHFVSPYAPEQAARKQPLKLGGQAQEDADLWNLVQPASPNAPAPGGVQSFEEALRRVDSSLEALVGAPAPAAQDEGGDLIIEAEVISVAPGGAAMPPKDPEPTDPAEAARLRRQRLLKRAMENLGNIPARDASQVTQSGIIAPPSSQSGVVAPPSPSSPSAAARAAAPSAADQQLAAQIEARFAQLSRKDHFLTLGIAPNATREQVKASFLNLAKTFHPDRLPPTLPHLAQKMSAVFEAIRDAYETLYDDTKRATWVSSQQIAKGAAPAGAPAPQTQASDLFKMAEVYFKKRDYKQAEVHFGKAFALDKSANSLAAQAWSIYMDPTRKAEAQSARQMMQKALQIDPNNDRANYQLGVIARVEGDMDRAERHFREAVRVNPRHLEANQELRLIEMRKKKAQQTPKGGGFFG